MCSYEVVSLEFLSRHEKYPFFLDAIQSLKERHYENRSILEFFEAYMVCLFAVYIHRFYNVNLRKCFGILFTQTKYKAGSTQVWKRF